MKAQGSKRSPVANPVGQLVDSTAASQPAGDSPQAAGVRPGLSEMPDVTTDERGPLLPIVPVKMWDIMLLTLLKLNIVDPLTDEP